MIDYEKMYSTLSNAVTDAIRILQKAQQDAEEIYISGKDADLYILKTTGERSLNEDNGN